MKGFIVGIVLFVFIISFWIAAIYDSIFGRNPPEDGPITDDYCWRFIKPRLNYTHNDYL